MGDSIQDTIVEALFSFGVMVVGLNKSRTVEIGGYLHDIGQPYADCISLDDWVHDTNARKWERMQFAGYRFKIPTEDAESCGLFDKKALKKVSSKYGGEINEDGEDRVSSFESGSEGNDEPFIEELELWYMWLPRENRVVVIDLDGDGPELMNVEWEGPECGPFHPLIFNRVPDNIMPKPPVGDWRDLNLSINTLANKAIRQANRQKVVFAVQGDATEDGNRIINAADGTAIRVDSPEKCKELKYGGVDQPMVALLIMLKDLFSFEAGNLDTMGGLSAMSETATQDKILNQNSSRLISDMQEQVINFVRQVVEALAFYLWNDPLVEYALTKEVPGIDYSIPFRFTQSNMEGSFHEYNFRIEPYSMQSQTPSQKLNTLRQVFMEFIAPFSPLLQAQGMTINFEGLLKLIGEYTNLSNELTDVITFSMDQLTGQGPVGEDSSQSPVTSRTYERVSRSGATGPGRDNQLIQSLLGGGPTPNIIPRNELMESTNAIMEPVIQFGFAGFSVVLLVGLFWFVKRLMDLLRTVTEVIERNTTAIQKVDERTGDELRLLRAVHDKLIARPCIIRGED